MPRLVLSRRATQRIVFTGPDGLAMEIYVAETAAGRVRIAIVAPETIKILRGELADRAAQTAAEEVVSTCVP